MWNIKKNHRNRDQISGCYRWCSGGWEGMGEGGQKVQTSSYKINKF